MIIVDIRGLGVWVGKAPLGYVIVGKIFNLVEPEPPGL